MIVDHYNISWILQSPSPLNWFKKLASKVNVSKVVLDCLNLHGKDIINFFTTLASMHNCEIVVFGFGVHTFTVKDLELMIEKDLNITYFESRAITNNEKISNLPGIIH